MKYIVSNNLKQPISYTLSDGETMYLASKGNVTLNEKLIESVRGLEKKGYISIEEVKENVAPVIAKEAVKEKSAKKADKEN